MYEQIFGFTARPFASTPNAQNYFPAEAIHYALSQTRLCVERASGPSVITGPSGTGKTLLLAMLEQQFEVNFQVVQLLCSNLSERKDLLQNILFELNLPYREMSEGELRLSLINHLKSGDIKTGVLMLVDDAHTLSAELLDEFRAITNFARNGRSAISLVMAGSPSLEGNLIETKSESFNQRIAVRSYLTNLNKSETIEYVLTQIERCGGNAESLFTGDALDSIFEYTDGCPRVINQLCDYTMVLAASQNATRITKEIVTDAWNDVQSIPGATGSVSAPKASSSYVTTDVTDAVVASGDMVIEFGSLDDDDSTGFVEAEPADTVVEFSSENNQEYRLQDEETTTTDSPTVEFDYSMIQSTTETTETEVEAEPYEPVPDFEDPFTESFEAEEAVDPTYVPFISAQNINSLMVTSDQLALLDAPFQPTSVDESLNREPETLETTLSVVDPDSESALATQTTASPDGIDSLQEMQESVRRLQRDLQFSQQDFSSEAVHPDFAIVANDQPIEELFQGQAESELKVEETVEEAVEETIEQTIEPPVIVSTNSDVQLQETALGDKDDDDRDMMIISRPEKFQMRDEEETESEIQTEVRISTGVAQRMDYEDLFRQLRTAN